MKDKGKIKIIEKLLEDIKFQNAIYSKEGSTVYFDYDIVIKQLLSVQKIISDTARAARPVDLPADMVWNENMDTDDIEPYIYNGDMSMEDFLEMQKLLGL